MQTKKSNSRLVVVVRSGVVVEARVKTKNKAVADLVVEVLDMDIHSDIDKKEYELEHSFGVGLDVVPMQ